MNIRKGLKRNQRIDFDDYKKAVSKVDKKMNRALLNSYETLHMVLGYDGNLRYKIVQDGLDEAQYILIGQVNIIKIKDPFAEPRVSLNLGRERP